MHMNVQQMPTEVTESRERHSYARLHGRWIIFARGLWLTLIVLTLVSQHLHLLFNSWWRYGLANLLLMFLLLGLGRGWIEVKRIYRERVPSLAVFRRA